MDIDVNELLKATAGSLNLKDFKGDVVLLKQVENEIGNIEAGGIGIQKVYNTTNAHPASAGNNPSQQKSQRPFQKSLHWDTLFPADGKNYTKEEMAQKIENVYSALASDYVEGNVDEFKLCFGIPVEDKAHPMKWKNNVRVLNYFLKKLYGGKMKDWDIAASLFVQTNGAPYTNLGSQSINTQKFLNDKEEKEYIDKFVGREYSDNTETEG